MQQQQSNQQIGKLIYKLTKKNENQMAQSPPQTYKKMGNKILKSRQFPAYKQRTRDTLQIAQQISKEKLRKVHKGSVVARSKYDKKVVAKRQKPAITIVGEKFKQTHYQENEHLLF